MSHPTLLVCAKVCHSWRKEAEVRLVTHVAVFKSGEGDVLIRSRDFNDASGSVILYEDFNGFQTEYHGVSLTRTFEGANVLDISRLDRKMFEDTSDFENWPVTFTRVLNPVEELAATEWFDNKCSDIDFMHPPEVDCFVHFHDGHSFSSEAPIQDARQLTVCIV